MNRIEVIFMNQGSAILTITANEVHYHHCYDDMELMFDDYKEVADLFDHGAQEDLEEAVSNLCENESDEYTLGAYYQDTTCYVVDSADFNSINKDYGENARIFAEVVEANA